MIHRLPGTRSVAATGRGSGTAAESGRCEQSAAMGILEKISEIEKEIARTQKNKGERGRRGPPPPFSCLEMGNYSAGMQGRARSGPHARLTANYPRES